MVYVVCSMAGEQVDCEEVAELERCEPGPSSDTNSNIATESEADCIVQVDFQIN